MTNTMKRFAAVLLAALLAVSMLSACANQGKQSPASSASSASSAAPSAVDSTLTIAMNVNLTSFDIHDQNNGYREGIFNNMFNYLVKRNNAGEIQPDLAEKYEKVDDLTWRFTLKKDVKFHNGDPLTAADVKFSLERVAKDEKLMLYDTYNQIAEVRVIDDLNLEIVTKVPDPILLYRVARMGSDILPKAYIDKVGMEQFSKNPVGSGPYRFVDFKVDDRLVLKKFPDYFEGDVADWDEVIFRVIPEASTRVGELVTGGVDIAAEIPPADWDRVNNNAGTEVLQADSTTIMGLMVRSMPGGPTADVRVRQAIDYAIDDGAIVDNLFKGSAVPIRSRVTPGNTFYHDGLFDTFLYDPDKAKQLLKEAGFEGGLDLTLQTTKGRNLLDSDVAQLVASMLTAVGIRTEVEIMETSRFSDAYNSGSGKDLMLNGSSNSMFDASHALRVYHTGGGKAIGYSNPVVDDLLDKAIVNMNPEERGKQYLQVQEIVAEEVPIVNLYLQKYYTGINSDKVSFEPRLDRAYIVREIEQVK